MTLDTTINLPTIISFGLVIIGFIIWLVRLEGKANASSEEVEAHHKTLGALEALVMLHKEQFHAYQLQVAREYVSNSVIAEIKRDIITELGRMESRVETQIDRIVEATKQ